MAIRRNSLSLITVFGLGFLRPAPGTWGSLPPVAVASGLIAAGIAPGTALAWVYYSVLALMLAVFSAACITQADEAEARYGKKDPSQVVADETAGQCIPLLAIPAFTLGSTATGVFALVFAFFAFRIADIFKPWPAFRLQSVPGGWGILLDDLVAGGYAAIILVLTASLTQG